MLAPSWRLPGMMTRDRRADVVIARQRCGTRHEHCVNLTPKAQTPFRVPGAERLLKHAIATASSPAVSAISGSSCCVSNCTSSLDIAAVTDPEPPHRWHVTRSFAGRLLPVSSLPAPMDRPALRARRCRSWQPARPPVVKANAGHANRPPGRSVATTGQTPRTASVVGARLPRPMSPAAHAGRYDYERSRKDSDDRAEDPNP